MTHSPTITSAAINGPGLGLRFTHFDEILHLNPPIEWFEVLIDNFFSPGPHHDKLDKIRQNYPIVFHSVGMSLGSTLDPNYLKKIKELKERYQPRWVSDHVSWSSWNGIQHHDLLPLPYNKETLRQLTKNILHVQDFLKEPILVENASTYVSFQSTEFSEAEFLNLLCHNTHCSLLLDINNLYVNQENHSADALKTIEDLKACHIRQIHLAGFELLDHLLYDTHGSPVSHNVWQLYEELLKKIGSRPTMIERDNNIPTWSEIYSEFEHLKSTMEPYL